MEMKNKKANTPLAVVLLVIMTCCLVITASFYILMKKTESKKVFSVLNDLAEVYDKEDLIKFYISKEFSFDEANTFIGGAALLEGDVVLIRKYNSKTGNLIEYRFKKPIS